MTDEEKTTFQAAEAIRNRLEELSPERLTIPLPTEYWERITHLVCQIEKASAHGWQRAAKSLRADLARAVDYCRDRLARLFVELDKEPSPVPTVSTLFHELRALAQEFEEIDFEEDEIRVTTERLVLDGIFLGPFQIQLNWERLGEPAPYRIKALDPHPAASNDAVTHPHVQDGRLCEGDGQVAIQNALLEGRLGDFFLLVAQVLRTYGKGSAYVELHDWKGVCCDDCGDSIGENERYYCNRCDDTLCDPCARACSGCNGTYCADCLEPCAVCDDNLCSSCLTECKNCHENVCDNCLTNHLCEKCHAELHTPSTDETAGDPGDEDPCDTGCGETSSPAAVAVGG